MDLSSRKTYLSAFFFLLLFSIATLVVAVPNAPESLFPTFSYLLYLFLGLYLPGNWVFKKLFGKEPGFVESLALGLPIMLVVEAIFFLLLMVVDLRPAIILLPLTCLFFIPRRILDKENPLGCKFNSSPIESLILGAGVIWLTYMGASILFTYIVPFEFFVDDSGSVDQLYHLGSLAEIKNHFPFQDPRMARTPYYYHFLLWFHIVASSFGSFASIDWIFTRLYILPLCLILVSQMYLMGKVLCNNRKVGGLLAVIFCVALEQYLFGTNLYNNRFIRYLFTSATFLPGVIYTAAFALTIPILLKKTKLHVKDFALFIVLAIGASTSKATVAPPILISMGLFWFYRCIQTRSFQKELFSLTFLLALVFGFFFLVTYGGSQGSAKFFVFFSDWNHPAWEQIRIALIEFFKISMPDTIHLINPRESAEILSFILYLMGFFGASLCAVYSFRSTKDEASNSLRQWLLFLALGSALMGFGISMEHHAEQYLLFPIMIPVSGLAALGFLRLLGRAKSSNSYRVLVFFVILIALNQAQLALTRLYPLDRYDQIGKSSPDNIKPANLKFFEGLRWIRNNTNKNDVVVSNLYAYRLYKDKIFHDYPHPQIYFLYSAMAERRSYLSGWAYWIPEDPQPRLDAIDRIFFEKDKESLLRIHKSHNVNIVVLDKRWPHKFSTSGWPLELIYSNESMDIFRVTD